MDFATSFAFLKMFVKDHKSKKNAEVCILQPQIVHCSIFAPSMRTFVKKGDLQVWDSNDGAIKDRRIKQITGMKNSR